MKSKAERFDEYMKFSDTTGYFWRMRELKLQYDRAGGHCYLSRPRFNGLWRHAISVLVENKFGVLTRIRLSPRSHFIAVLISLKSHTRAWGQQYLAVRGEISSVAAASSMVMPMK
jgi:hypothetical protein